MAAKGWTFGKKIAFLFYKLTASWLPKSGHSRIGKSLRRFWAKRIAMSCGKNVNIERHAFFTPELRIGDNSGVGIDCELNGPITLGKDVMMGPECVIYTRNHKYDRTDVPMDMQGMNEPEPVTIGDNVWIGRRVMIMPGVNIGEGSVIAAGAVVCKDVPPRSVVGGVPARVIKWRE